MPITYTTNAHLMKPDDNIGGWGTIYNDDLDQLDGMPMLHNFACTIPDQAGTGPSVRVRGGGFRWVEFLAGELFGDYAEIKLKPYTTNYLFEVWENLNVGKAWPNGVSFIPVAIVTTDKLTAAVIEDQRCPYLMTGFSHLIPLDYADDAAASSGGVEIGELYHTLGVVQIRRV